MLKEGYIADHLYIRPIIMADFINGEDIKTIQFWNPNNHDIFDLINLNADELIHKTLEYHGENALKKCSSIPLIYLNPNLVYKESKRPITGMKMFKQPVKLPNLQELYPNKISVTRYATSMSGRLYNTSETFETSDNTKYLGTFYYYEKESETYLCYNTSATFKNKYECLITLDTNKNYSYLRNYIENNKCFIDWHNGIIPKDLMLTPSQAYKLRKLYGGIYNQEYVDSLPQKLHYSGHYLSLYAVEDELDQAICRLGKNHGIDIIILSEMAGCFKVVTEILDTRDRLVSFSSLV